MKPAHIWKLDLGLGFRGVCSPGGGCSNAEGETGDASQEDDGEGEKIRLLLLVVKVPLLCWNKGKGLRICPEPAKGSRLPGGARRGELASFGTENMRRGTILRGRNLPGGKFYKIRKHSCLPTRGNEKGIPSKTPFYHCHVQPGIVTTRKGARRGKGESTGPCPSQSIGGICSGRMRLEGGRPQNVRDNRAINICHPANGGGKGKRGGGGTAQNAYPAVGSDRIRARSGD